MQSLSGDVVVRALPPTATPLSGLCVANAWKPSETSSFADPASEGFGITKIPS